MESARGDKRTRSSSESLIDALHSPVVSNLTATTSSASQNSSTNRAIFSDSYHHAADDAAADLNSIDSSSQSVPQINIGNSNSNSTSNNNNNNNNNRRQPSPTSSTSSSHNYVSKEQERKELILYLLAQVCALHDATPKTFIIHVLSLYESGILDDESMRLLINHGLVPSAHGLSTKHEMNHKEQPAPLQGPGVEQNLAVGYPGGQQQQQHHHHHHREQVQGNANIDAETAISAELGAMVPISVFNAEGQSRSQTVFAIRKHLEQHEAMDNWKHFNKSSVNATTSPTPTAANILHHATKSWSVEHHPLSFSRYNRDFFQKKMLASGSFGQVFHAVNKLDRCNYAVKRVAFSAKGYDTKQVEMVIREVQCLAKLGHDNVVRYYTSWLEPIWTPGGHEYGSGTDIVDSDGDEIGDHSDIDCDSDSDSGDSSSIEIPSRMGPSKLLLGGPETGYDAIQNREDTLLNDGKDRLNESRAGISAWSFDRTRNDSTQDDWEQLASHCTNESQSNSISTGEYGMDQTENSEYSEWTVEQSSRVKHGKDNPKSKYTSRRMHQSTAGGTPSQQQRHRSRKNEKPYKYQICLYIQMQLCRPATLADWIRNRNSTKLPKSLSAQHKRFLDAAAIFRHISSGLAHVHSRSIVHRDLKPANIFQSVEDESFKIGDFGLSKMLQSANGGMTFENKPGTLIVPLSQNHTNDAVWDDPLTAGVGTSSYAAPEQLTSQSYASEADIFRYACIVVPLYFIISCSVRLSHSTFYSLGLILLELVSNFGSGHERAATFQNCRKGVLPEWLTASPPLSDVCDLILSCTKQRPKDRPRAHEIIKHDLFNGSKIADMQSTVITNLEDELEKKEVENERLRRIVERQAVHIRHVAITNGSANQLTNGNDTNDLSDDDY